MTDNWKRAFIEELREEEGTNCEFLSVVERIPEYIFKSLEQEEFEELAREIHDEVIKG